PAANLSVLTSYNHAGMSCSPKEIASALQREEPDLQVSYQPDFRQQIAESWPESIDDSQARTDWGWKPKFDLAAMTKDMLRHLQEKYALV
ncbi:MAG: NAD-dependent epimerase, partial [Bacteroidetes bacterium]|nr:NAD-dependent epimerase [Bacteroidota bacterium]